jgi:hypothetical protein
LIRQKAERIGQRAKRREQRTDEEKRFQALIKPPLPEADTSLQYPKDHEHAKWACFQGRINY